MKLCILIPNYNHVAVIESMLEELTALNLPVIMVDDGSKAEAATLFNELGARFELLTLVTHEVNQGKGGAVQTGLRRAHEMGFSHALQVDADGQHALEDIHRLIAMAKETPDALISGRPVYDESVPKHRYLSRYITHFWVWVETLSLDIADSMCGFRVYPLAATVALLDSKRLGKRMDFDPEIMVRLYWRGVPVRFLATKVIYPENGLSHFRPFEDNVKISWLHTRLFFAMLPRSPRLLWRKLVKRSA